MSDPRGEINTLRSRLEQGERGADDADVLLRFSDRLDLLQSEYSDHRHLKLLRHCTRMAENVGGLEAALDDREAAEAIVRWINRTYDNQETNRDYRVALRVFGLRLEPDDGDPPESLAWVPASTSSDYDPAPNPADMLTWEDDVEAMIDAANNSRDKALFAIQFDAGLRGGELHDLRVGDLSDGNYGLRVFVDGKTGQRSVDLIPSVGYVKRWLQDHPAKSDGDAYVWTQLGEAERLSYSRFLACFRESAERAGVTKPVTPTNFRKSNATWLARKGANAALIEDRQGRARGSKAVARYVARFGDDTEAQYAAMHGMDIDEGDEEEPASIPCPRCDQPTPRSEPRCLHCNFSMSLNAINEDGKINEELVQLAADNPEAADAAMRMIRALGTDPRHASFLNRD